MALGQEGTGERGQGDQVLEKLETTVRQLLTEFAPVLQTREFGESFRGPGLIKVDQGAYTYVLARFRSSRRRRTHLTRREEDVARLVGRGLANKEIASELGLRPTTIAAYLGRIYRKLDIESRTALARESLLF